MSKNNMFSLSKQLNYHTGGLSHILILKDGRLSSSAADNNLIIYNKNNFTPDLIIQEHSDLVNYHIQLKNENLVTCSWDYTLKIIKLLDNNKYKVIQKLKEHKFVVNKAIELENEKMLTVADDKFIILWKKNLNNNLYEVEKKIKCSVNNYPNINIVLINNDLLLSSSLSDYKLRFFEINNNFQLAFYFDNLDLCFSRNSVLYINEKDLLLVGGIKDNGVYLFKLKKIPTFIGKIFSDWINEVYSIILTEDGNILMGLKEKEKEDNKNGSENKDENYSYSICKFEIGKNNEVIFLDKVKNAHKDLINGIIHWKEKNMIVSCSKDKKVNLWKINTK